VARVLSSAGTALVADNTKGGKIFSAQNNGVEKFSVDGSGNVTTSGSVAAAQLVSSFATITNGNLNLPQTAGSSVGVITMGGAPFIHACCSASQYNTFVGPNAGNFTTTGGWNTASGYGALHSNTTGDSNTASGNQALYSNTTGFANTASGQGALTLNTTGSFNTGSGYGALLFNTTGQHNTASGFEALGYNTTGSQNTALGVYALYLNCYSLSSGCTANNNTGVGYNASSSSTPAIANITGANDTFIGANSGPGTSTQLNNATAIGANALVSVSNALVLGGTGANAVNVGIGTQTPAYTLDVVGTGRFGGTQFPSYGGVLLPPTGTATTFQGFSSNHLDFATSAYNSVAAGALNLNFRWQAEPVGNNTSTPNATLNLLSSPFGGMSETGLSIGTNGVIHFAPDQTFPGSGSGSVTSVVTGTGLTGGPITSTGTISINPSVVPVLSVSNTFTAAQTVNVGSGNAIVGQTISTVAAIVGINAGTSGRGVSGAIGSSNPTGCSGHAAGVCGDGGATGAPGIYATASNGNAVVAIASSSSSEAIQGLQGITTPSFTYQAGVYGESGVVNGNGVVGVANQGSSLRGVLGISNGGYGVVGQSTGGDGVVGTSSSGKGVYGSSSTGYAGYFSGNVYVTGTVTATTYNVSSSRRWKTNIQTLHRALERVERLRGVSYDAKADGQHNIGLIAEEVGEVVPEVVVYEENGNDAKSVDYARLSALLIEAVKEQQAQIQELKSQIEKLNAYLGEKTVIASR